MSKKSKNYIQISKDLKTAQITLDLTELNIEDPEMSKGGTAYVLGKGKRFAFELDFEGVTLPIDMQLSSWVGRKNWKEFVMQRDGIREGNEQGTNTDETDKLLKVVEQQQKQINALMQALGV